MHLSPSLGLPAAPVSAASPLGAFGSALTSTGEATLTAPADFAAAVQAALAPAPATVSALLPAQSKPALGLTATPSLFTTPSALTEPGTGDDAIALLLEDETEVPADLGGENATGRIATEFSAAQVLTFTPPLPSPTTTAIATPTESSVELSTATPSPLFGKVPSVAAKFAAVSTTPSPEFAASESHAARFAPSPPQTDTSALTPASQQLPSSPQSATSFSPMPPPANAPAATSAATSLPPQREPSVAPVIPAPEGETTTPPPAPAGLAPKHDSSYSAALASPAPVVAPQVVSVPRSTSTTQKPDEDMLWEKSSAKKDPRTPHAIVRETSDAKTSLTRWQPSGAREPAALGIGVAKLTADMPATLSQRQSLPVREKEKDSVSFSGESIVHTQLRPLPPVPVAAAHQVLHTVLRHLERPDAPATPRVDLQFTFGEEPLTVRVELRDGEVRTVFQSASPELRAALAREWPQFAAQMPARVAEPQFTAAPHGTLDFSSGDSPAHRHTPASPEPASPAFSRGARSDSTPSSAASDAPPSRLPGLSLLNALA